MCTPWIRLAAALALCALVAGCDVLESGTAIVAEGTVIDASLGTPAEGIGVALTRDGPGLGPALTVTRTQTDARGRYRIAFDDGTDWGSFDVRINSGPYDETYSPTRYAVRPGGRYDETSEIHQYVTLTVRAVPTNPSDGRSVFLWLPGTGARSRHHTTTRAQGNGDNEVRLVVGGGAGAQEIVDTVYCPVGEATELTIPY